MATFHCVDCGHDKPVQQNGGTGYAITDGKYVCYDCCAIRDSADMIQTGRATLYLSDRCVTNWPDTLSFPVQSIRRFLHPFARSAYLGTFIGPDSNLWRFKNIGESQITHCRRTA